MSFFQKRSGGPFPEPINPPFPGVNPFGGLTTSTAMQIDAVWSCVRLLADSVSMMPLHAYTVRDGQRVRVPAPSLLQQPAAYGTLQDWLYSVMVSLLLNGNAYGRVVRWDSHGYPAQIELVDPAICGMRFDGTRWVTTINGVEIDPREVWHIGAFLQPGSPVGLSPIKYAARTVSTLQAAEAFGQSYFQDGAHPSSVLSTSEPINQDQAKQIKERFQSAVNGREPVVLGAGLQWQAIQVTPEESQFLATQKFGITKIARIFGVPPEMIGGEAGNAMTYANVTQRAMDFLTYSVQPWLTRIEHSIFPLLPNVKHVRFDTSALVRLDEATKWTVNQTKVNTGARVINELRADEGDSPVEWGDRPYLPGMFSSAARAAIQFGEEAGAGSPAPVVGGSNDQSQ